MTPSLRERLKIAARIIFSGEPNSYYDDEAISFNIKPLIPAFDTKMSGRRLSILTPSLSSSQAFGGLDTQIRLPIQVFQHALVQKGWQLRFICTGKMPAPEDNIAARYLDRFQIPPTVASMHYGSGAGEPVPVGAGDIFWGSLWYDQLCALPLMQFQHDQFGGPKTPYISMVQDYEAGFHPWSSAFMLARASYDSDWPKRLVFNSNELAEFYKAQGHKFEDCYTFEPVMNASLRKALDSPGRPDKERRILFYGRPKSRRNCYYLARKALAIWAETYEDSRNWRVVSVGSDHAPFKLANGVPLDILGKLSMVEYSEELHKAAVGISLMASPHPSYPPLEMAHFGVLTVCNVFEHKDLRVWHDNLLSVTTPSPVNLADTLTQACLTFEADTAIGGRGQSRKAHYLQDMDPSILRDIATMIARGV